MTNKDIEKTVSSAFSKAVPDVLASVLEQCDEQKGSVLMNNNAEMTDKTNKKRPVLRAVLIAAVLTVAMAVTVTAVSMTGLIDEREAFLRAYEHLVETSEEGEDIANLVIAGEENRLGSTVYEADLGLKSGRIVYKIDFQFIETIYHYTIDAKTAVVLDYSSEPAPVSLLELEPEPEKPAGVLTEDDIKAIVKEDSGIDVFFVQYTEPDDRGNPFFTSLYQVYAYSRVDDDFPDYHYYIDAYSGEIIRRNIIPETGFNPDDPDNFDYTNAIQQSRVRYTVEDHFGLTYLDSGIHYDDGYVFYMGYLEDGTYEVFEAAGGYVYHAFVDPDTFEIISEEITEHPHYDGEMVKAEPREDYIGMIEAENIAAKYFGIDPDTYKGYKPGLSNYCAAEPENGRPERTSALCFDRLPYRRGYRDESHKPQYS